MAQQQSDYRFTFTTAAGNFDLVSFNLTESLSKPFNLELKLSRMNEESVDFASVLDDSATLVFWKGEQPIRFINGIVCTFYLTESGVRRTDYSATVVPSYARTQLGSNVRIFQQQTVPDILALVLKENGITPVKFDLSGVHETREYCVQYRETHQKFIERLAAEEGLFYYFEHTENTHTLVWCDDTQKLTSLGQILHNPNISASRTEPSLWGFSYQEQIATAQHKLKDYSFKNPNYGQDHKAQANNAQNQHKSYLKYDYPGRYKTDAAGKPFNQHRLEFERRDSQVARASSDDLKLIAGKHIKLSQSPTAKDNQNWLIVSAKHHAKQPQSLQEDSASSGGSSYSSSLTLIPQGQAWQATPQHKPTVDGPQIARVTGPKGEEIYCDEHGRVKIQFPWDLEGKYDDHSSCWVRVSQDWAGVSWGHIAIPRIGQEVIVSFLEGDPDQPIITGRTYHAYNKAPYELPAHKTRMSIKSKTHKGDGFNELRFEDEADQEQLFIHAQKDQDIRVLNDTREWIGNDRHLVTKKDQFEVVEGSKHSSISKDRYEQIDGNQHLCIQGNQNDKIIGSTSRIISQDLQEKIALKYATEAGNEIHFKAGINSVLEAGASITLKVGGNFINLNPSGIFINGSAVTLNSGGAPTVGSGSQPTQATPPRIASEADDAKPGWKAEPPPPVTALEAPTIEKDTSLQVLALMRAAEVGAAVCEKCDEAKKAVPSNISNNLVAQPTATAKENNKAPWDQPIWDETNLAEQLLVSAGYGVSQASEALQNIASWESNTEEIFDQIGADPNTPEALRLAIATLKLPARIGTGIVSGTAGVGDLILNPDSRSQLYDGVETLYNNPEILESKMADFANQPAHEIASDVLVLASDVALGGAGGAKLGRRVKNTRPPKRIPEFSNLKQMDKSYVGEETGAIWGTKVKYLDDIERQQYQLNIKNGKLYDTNGNLFDTANAQSAFGGEGNAIFVMDEHGSIYASTVHTPGKFHHSSFLSGQPVASAGEIVVKKGVINEVTRRSGHYQPTSEQLEQFTHKLKENGVNMKKVNIGAGF